MLSGSSPGPSSTRISAPARIPVVSGTVMLADPVDRVVATEDTDPLTLILVYVDEFGGKPKVSPD